MRKTMLISVLASLSATTYAQSSVTLYGVIDAGLIYQNQTGGNAFVPKTKSSVVTFAGGGGSDSSEFGMKGVEDLGGGSQVGFSLLGQFDSGSGALTSAGQLFDGEANVYYQGPYGRVTAGEQIDPAYIALVVSDPRSAKHAYSAAGSWSLLQGKENAPSQTMFESNSVSYFYQGHGVLAEQYFTGSVGNQARSHKAA